MTTYHLQRTNFYDTQKITANCTKKVKSCFDLDTGAMVRNGTTLQLSIDSMKKIATRRYNNPPVLAVGDFLELFEVPTYSYIDTIAIFHDASLGGFKFEVEIARVIDTEAARTVTPVVYKALIDKEEAATVTYGAVLATPSAIGAVVGRDIYQVDNVRNNHRAVIRLKITAVPTPPTPGQTGLSFFDVESLNFFASFKVYSSCVCKSTAKNPYLKSNITTYA
jgi:hypothetical protein